jgi:chromosome segregation ATPase
MINVFVEGRSWPEVAQELRKMLGDEPDIVIEKSADYEELEAMRRQLDEADARAESYENTCATLRDKVRELEKQLTEQKGQNSSLLLEIEELEKIITDLRMQLADAKAPRQAEPTEGDTETPAPSEEEEEEQTEITEVTEAPVKEYKKEEVRAVLVKCRAANISLTEILAPYGGSLGAVKPEDYAKVVRAAEAALEDK